MLYALVVVAAVVEIAVAIVVPAGRVANLIQGAIGVGMLGGAAWWARANRVAFDLDGWCECATATVTMRVVQSHVPDAPSDGPVEDKDPAITV